MQDMSKMIDQEVFRPIKEQGYKFLTNAPIGKQWDVKRQEYMDSLVAKEWQEALGNFVIISEYAFDVYGNRLFGLESVWVKRK